MNIEETDTFGNYLIHGIDEIVLPDVISWWPSAPGWQVLGVIVFLWLLTLAVRLVKHDWRNRYRRQALRQLDQVQNKAGSELLPVVALLPYYLKVTALQAYPRQNVASLTGNEWLSFLDAHYSGPSFSKSSDGKGMGEHLLSIAYLPQAQWRLNDAECKTLIEMTRRWISTHIEGHIEAQKEATDV